MTKTWNPSEIAKTIDHTCLRPDATEEDIRRAALEAKEYGFRGLCIESKWLSLTASILKGTPTLLVTVISFPHGTDASEKKAEAAQEAVAQGAQEVDMVLNRKWLSEKDFARVFEDIRSVTQAISGTPVKVILETSELSDEEKVLACGLAKAAGAKFVKTSTGFSKSGATVQDVSLMRRIVGPSFGVKASGGVRSYEDAVAMLDAGASRLGTSASVAILKGGKARGAY